MICQLKSGSDKSSVFRVKIDGVVCIEKRFKKAQDAQKELDFMQQLSSSKHFPTILRHDKKTIVMKNGGSLLRKENCPPDYKKQLLDILTILESKQIYHNDLWKNNLIVDEETQVIQMIDFGWATTHKPGYPHMNLTRTIIQQASSIKSLYAQLWKIRDKN